VGKERQAPAWCSGQWILHRHYLKQEYKNDSGLAVLQILGYDNQKQKFFEVKFDNQETGILHTEGMISQTARCSPIGDGTGPDDQNHFTVEWYLPMDDGAEQKTMTMSHT
jgi:Protein of unknown function (DUF1579)